MTYGQMRSEMEALMTRLVQTERALMDNRQQIAAAPKAAASLVDTRTIGKAPTFTGEHKDWSEWSFQFTAHMGSANPKSVEALRWAAMADGKITPAAVVQQSFEVHIAQLFLAYGSNETIELLLRTLISANRQTHATKYPSVLGLW